MNPAAFIRKYRLSLTFGAIVLAIAAWSMLLTYVSPREIVEAIGVRNIYFLVFAVAAIGGLSSFTGPSLYALVATAAAGGSNPLLLALIGGIGIFISDGVFYAVARYGRRVALKYWEEPVEKLKEWSERLPQWVIYAGVFVYTGLTPLPNDILMIALAFSEQKFKKVAPFLLAGDMVLVGIVAYAAQAGYRLL